MTLNSAKLAGAISPEAWQCISGRSWLPILTVSSAVEVGMSADGDWLLRIERPDGVVEIKQLDSDAGVAALPLLERSLSAVRDTANERAIELDVSSAVMVAALPIEAVVRAALRGRSEYWTGLATEWLEADPSTVAAVAEDITPVLDDRRVSQDLRNRLRRLRKAGV